MTENYVQMPGGKVWYTIYRHSNPLAKTIVFTHGLTADSTMFEKQVEYFEKDYSLILWDVPRHGRSRPYSNFTYHETAVALNAILEKENIPAAVLAGMSMGGYPCQFFADIYPEKVLGFIGIDTTPLGKEYYSRSDIFWLEQVEWMAACFPGKLLKYSMAKSVSVSDFSYNKMMEMMSKSSSKEISRQMGIAYGQFIKENKDIEFNFPFIILVGDKDSTGKVKYYCEKWHEKTGRPLYYIKNARHFSNGDNPRQVNGIIDDFIKSL